MPIFTIILVLLGLGAILLYFIAEAVFDALFSYIGATAVWLLTFGHIRMEPLRGGESELAKFLGFGVTLILAFLICYIIQRP